MGPGELADEVDNLPQTCLRGLKKADWVKDGSILTPAFLPDQRTAEARADGGQEVSVDWEDDDNVEARALAQWRQAAHGLARLPRSEADRINRMPNTLRALLCERYRLDDNPHHGNIVFTRGLAKHHIPMIASALALASTHVPSVPRR